MTRLTKKGSDHREFHLESAGCGRFCDDTAVRLLDGKPTETRSACAQGEEWLRSLERMETLAWAEGKRIDLEGFRADPLRTHPGHLERYSLQAPPLDGRKRNVVLVDAARAEANLTPPRADEVLNLDTDGGLAADVEIVRDLPMRQ